MYKITYIDNLFGIVEKHYFSAMLVLATDISYKFLTFPVFLDDQESIV